ncbi:MAG: DUF502 domain-containing protein [Phycisphaerae bacterium]|nr:DUF502 domain-containing protein [Phycisphaerae bacterium]
MRQAIKWFWSRGIVSTFLAGFFLVLPVFITIGIMTWLADNLQAWLGTDSSVGKALHSLGLQFVTDEKVAIVVGWAIILIAIWLLGALGRSVVLYKITAAIEATINRVPLIGSIYRPVSQVVELLKKDDKAGIKGMHVVYCDFGHDRGGGFLGLQASKNAYRFGETVCYLIYIPMSPLPMSGGIVFVPVQSVRAVEMEVDDLFQIYLSLGVLTSKVVPARYNAAVPAA